MQRKENSLPFFITFFVLSLFLIFLGESGFFSSFSSFFNRGIGPVRNVTFGILTFGNLKNKTIESLSLENQNLRNQLVDKNNLINENKALKDQFANTNLKSHNLLPAKVVGAPGFVPGVSLPQFLIIDKGLRDNLKTGSTVIVGNYLVGEIISLSMDFSKVELVVNRNSSFAVKIQDPNSSSQVVGVIKGQGNKELILDNVLLTQTIRKDELVLTKGEMGENGNGYPPDLVVGKIVSIDKKPSSLFQKADVLSFINFINLETVFIIK